jgi:hypothetical protein
MAAARALLWVADQEGMMNRVLIGAFAAVVGMSAGSVAHATSTAAAVVKAKLGDRAARVVVVGPQGIGDNAHYAMINSTGKQVRIATVSPLYSVGSDGHNIATPRDQIKIVHVTPDLVPAAEAKVKALRGPGAKIQIGDRTRGGAPLVRNVRGGQRAALSKNGYQILLTSTVNGRKQLEGVGLNYGKGEAPLGNAHKDAVKNLGSMAQPQK